MARNLTRLAMSPGMDPREVRRELSRFAGKLRVHATMENDALYPSLLASDDPEIRRRAGRLHAEVGTLYDAFDSFMDEWGDAGAIDRRRVRFRIELVRMLSVLGRRMVRENRELYPMADEIVAGSTTAG